MRAKKNTMRGSHEQQIAKHRAGPKQQQNTVDRKAERGKTVLCAGFHDWNNE
ncbi:hypothetical protein [Saccharopolyspora rectivirgula]|uniref:hypothetical protein n=1 Tax=Saccharopolyspora rectivirgula TaxID=28042 RepID=UPI0003FDA64E|nr:hypothetical protein [Saccharopolyspora rectivirgula]